MDPHASLRRHFLKRGESLLTPLYSRLSPGLHVRLLKFTQGYPLSPVPGSSVSDTVTGVAGEAGSDC